MISEIRFATVSVSELGRSQSLFQDVIGMELVGRQQIRGPDYERLWGLKEGTEAEAVLLGKPGIPSGRIRLLKFQPLSSVVVRECAEPWDTGAVKILDFLVTDFEQARRAFASHGWQWRTEPQRYWWPGREGATIEGHIKGPDGILLGIGQVIGPPRSEYVEATDDSLFSEMATSSFLVPNLERALAFYKEVLGLTVSLEMEIEEAELQKLVGLPAGVALRMVFLGSPDSKSGKVGLLKYSGIEGRSLAERVRPPNRGTVLITFETDSISPLPDRLTQAGAQIISLPVHIDLEPYGRVLGMTARAPDGVLLEFFQQI